MKLYSAGTTIDQIFKNIKELNHEPPIMTYNSRTAICIDATGSMGAVLPKVIQVVQGAIPDIYKTIEEEKVQGSFELKIVIYRNYSSGAQLLLQTTNFESKSEPLINWLNAIRVNGGQGNEAIEVCFQHINSLDEVHQCVIIGDAAANTQAETVSKRSCQAETYWNSNGFPLTNFDAEVQKLIQKKIKVHSYYLNPSHTSNFYKKLSADTSGVSEEFKINEKEATKNFADFVANKIISNLGEMVGGDAKERMLKRYMEVSKKKKYV